MSYRKFAWKQMLHPTSNKEVQLQRAWKQLHAIAWADGVQQLASFCAWIRAFLLVPLVQLSVAVCLAMTVMILVEKVTMGMVCIVIKILGLRPEKRYKWEAIVPDMEKGSAVYPMVLVQIPMYNEKEVYKLCLKAACELDWPSDRLIVQVLDDSTDPVVQDLVELECRRWQSKGVNMKYVFRDNRNGYKAGALRDGMEHDYVQDCEFVAIFDADFQPDPDFLARAIPFLVHNPRLGLVQARWVFLNADECLMTRMQEMTLNYHFKVEQEAGSRLLAFFGFNGTAGVWRVDTIIDAGGWKSRTTVEDMDLAVRASLRGWKFVFVNDIEVKNELPSTLKAFRYQQHRWSCGPANLFKKMALEVILNKKVSVWKKFHLMYNFFFVGKIVAHTVAFLFYCTVIPISVLFPEVCVPKWGVFYIPMVIVLCKSVTTPRSFHLAILWILFENVMSLVRIKAASTGLFEAERVNEWVVTQKLGEAHKNKPVIKQERDLNGSHQLTEPLIPKLKKQQTSIWDRFYYSELGVGVFLLLCGYYDVVYAHKGFFLYLFLQSLAFFLAGFGYLGNQITSS